MCAAGVPLPKAQKGWNDHIDSAESAAIGARAADTWLIYLTSDGSAPDPDVDTPTEVAMVNIGGLARLDWDSTAYAAGTTIKVIIRTRRTGEADSTNTNILTATAAVDGDTEISPGACWGIERGGETITRVWTHDADNYIDLIQQTGAFRFVVGGSSPSTISLYDVEANQKVGSVNLSMDIRNAIHGLEAWPFND